MKLNCLILLLLLHACTGKNIQKTQLVHTSDIDRFWTAYDMINASNDSIAHYEIIKEEYIDKGTDGLKALLEKRNYTAKSYIEAIHAFPEFWESIRVNTTKANLYSDEIEININKLKVLYPALKPAQVYFTIGALMTGGQAHNGCVLIGSEIAMSDSNTVTHELEPEWLRENLEFYFNSNPIDDLVLLNVHEYVHTQQGDYGTDLLSMSIFEGVAEFVSVLASEKPSVAPALAYGAKHADVIRDRFQKEMFSPNWNDWLYNDRKNEFGCRDLGYYVGYTICEKYYNNMANKKQAIKEIIELDCADNDAVFDFVNKSEYLSISYEEIKSAYLLNKPFVKGVSEFENGKDTVNPDIKSISLEFSKPINQRFRNFKLGPLGESHLLPITGSRWSEDGKTLIFDVELMKGEHYQIVVDSEFRDLEGRPIESYLIDFKTNK